MKISPDTAFALYEALWGLLEAFGDDMVEAMRRPDCDVSLKPAWYRAKEALARAHRGT